VHFGAGEILGRKFQAQSLDRQQARQAGQMAAVDSKCCQEERLQQDCDSAEYFGLPLLTPSSPK